MPRLKSVFLWVMHIKNLDIDYRIMLIRSLSKAEMWCFLKIRPVKILKSLNLINKNF